MEPERKIEKLLRAYAKKRRADAGDPLKLHPANRHILQDEAARRAPAPGEGDESNLLLLFFAVFRRGLAFALCVVVIIFIGASVLLPGLISMKRKAQRVNAVNNLKEIGMATRQYAQENKDVLPASLDLVTNAWGTSKVLIDPVTGKPFVYAGGGKKLDELQTNAVLAYSAENKNGHAVLFADGHVETVSSARFAELTNEKPPELALADKSARERLVKATTTEPALTPAPAPSITSDLEKQKTEVAVSQAFAQVGTASNLQNLFRNDSVSARTAPVLQSFQVQQNGDAISVVDRDGSVYHGSLQVTNTTALNEPATAETPAAPATPPQAEGKMAQAAGNEQPAVPNYFFRVAGTNRTLQQNVVFTGNFLANNGAPQTAQTSNSFGGVGGGGGGGAGNQLQQAAANQLQQWSLSNSRIVGTAVIASTNQIEINAVPVTQ
jgi:prepilin-type processing-associated H-X9-DG protein